jgi:hypothetical protein
MSDDLINRLITKIDDLRERLARVETILAERDRRQTNYTGLLGWIVTTAIAVYAAIKH